MFFIIFNLTTTTTMKTANNNKTAKQLITRINKLIKIVQCNGFDWDEFK